MSTKLIVNHAHLDANESAFAARELETIRTQTYDLKLIQLKGRSLVPMDTSLPVGANVVRYYQYNMTGMAVMIANYSMDLPRADVFKKEFFSPIFGLGTSYGFSIQDIQAARTAGVPLEQRKANAARRAFEEKLDKIIQTGDTATGLLGLLNQPNTSSYVVPNGGGGSPLWANKTADEILKDLNGIVNSIVVTTNEVEIPNTILLPPAQYQLITNTARSATSDTTIKQFFLANNEYIKTIKTWTALTGAGAGGTNRMVCYRAGDPDAIQLVMPQDFTQLPPQNERLEILTYCVGRTGGVVVYYPLSISYGDGI